MINTFLNILLLFVALYNIQFIYLHNISHRLLGQCFILVCLQFIQHCPGMSKIVNIKHFEEFYLHHDKQYLANILLYCVKVYVDYSIPYQKLKGTRGFFLKVLYYYFTRQSSKHQSFISVSIYPNCETFPLVIDMDDQCFDITSNLLQYEKSLQVECCSQHSKQSSDEGEAGPCRGSASVTLTVILSFILPIIFIFIFFVSQFVDGVVGDACVKFG